MSLSSNHEFHFIMDENMKMDLLNLSMGDNRGTLSGKIMKILSIIMPIIKKVHKWGDQKYSQYLPITNEPEKKRHHMHTYFPEHIYRQLKLMHHDLNFYSIGQLVRGFLRIFLSFVKHFGNKVYWVLNQIFKRWNEEDKLNKLTTHDLIRHLSLILQHFPDQSGFINIYTRFYSPFWINFQ